MAGSLMSKMEDQLMVPLSLKPRMVSQLPEEILQRILSYISYEETAQLRIVNTFFNGICSRRLNSGFSQVESIQARSLKAFKSQLPRRESERKRHRLSRHCDALSAIETRLSLLTMTFSKYIDNHMCCFFPGKVLDELFRLIELINKSECVTHPHEQLQELRDISSMAMEFFDDRIAPDLRKRLPQLDTPRMIMDQHSFTFKMNGVSVSPSTFKMFTGHGSNYASGQGDQRVRGPSMSLQNEELEKVSIQTRLFDVKIKRLENGLKDKTIKLREMEKERNIMRQQLTQQGHALTTLTQQVAELTRMITDSDYKAPQLPLSSPSPSPSPPPPSPSLSLPSTSTKVMSPPSVTSSKKKRKIDPLSLPTTGHEEATSKRTRSHKLK